jgi:hypothetical protein
MGSRYIFETRVHNQDYFKRMKSSRDAWKWFAMSGYLGNEFTKYEGMVFVYLVNGKSKDVVKKFTIGPREKPEWLII